MNKKIEFIFNGPPVPACRINHQNRWTDRVLNYLGYKDKLREALVIAFPQHVIGLPGPLFKKEHAKALKAYKNIRYRLDYVVYLDRDVGDWDNYGKGISDALQDAGLVVNDKKIKSGSWDIQMDKLNPRIEFSLQTID